MIGFKRLSEAVKRLLLAETDVQEAFHRVYQAFETLADSSLRAKYDLKISEKSTPGPKSQPCGDEHLLRRIQVLGR